MKKTLSASLFILIFTFQTTAFAQNMMTQPVANNMMYFNQNLNEADQTAITETSADEAAGKAIWDKLQNKQTDCKSLTEDDYDVLGDYFMGLMSGGNHATMNTKMTNMMGTDGEKQMHIVMGERLSGCNTEAALPSQFQQFSILMPMMGLQNGQNLPPMMKDFNSPIFAWHNNMMSQFGFPMMAIVCGITLLLVWGVLLASIAALIHYTKKSKK